MKGVGDAAGGAGRLSAHLAQEVVEVEEGVAGVKAGVDLLRVEEEADGVAGLDHDVAEGGGELARVFVLGGAGAAEVHGGAAVEGEVHAEVGLVLEAFDVILVGAGDDAPVDVLGVVAEAVGLVVGELGAGAAQRAAVRARRRGCPRRRRARAARGG